MNGAWRVIRTGCLLLAALLFSAGALADPEADRASLRDYYAKRFSAIPLEDHKDGAYALDADTRAQWQELEEFPLYEIAVDTGAELFAEPFADGAGYADCFGEPAVKQQYPRFDEDRGQVVTLENAINDCRTQHGEPAYSYTDPALASLLAYIAFESRGKTIDVALPAQGAARAAYEQGKQFYASRRGNLNFSCGSCHVQMVGNMLRGDRLSASLGHVSHWPVYRLKWQEVGGLHRRFQECNSQVGAVAFELQSEEYRNLEFFLSYMSNGLPLNGPATRK